MTKYLARQIGDIDQRLPLIDHEAALKIDPVEVENRPKLRGTPVEFAEELILLKRKSLMEITRIFWSFQERIKASFPHDQVQEHMGRVSDPWMMLVNCIASYLTYFVRLTEIEMAQEEGLQVMFQLVDKALHIEAIHKDEQYFGLVDLFYSEMRTGVSIWAQFIELVPRVYQNQFGRQITEEEYKGVIQSNVFITVAVSMGLSSAPGERVLFNSVRAIDPALRRSRLTPECFEFIERRGALILKMKDATNAHVREDFAENGVALDPKSQCPAVHVRGEDGVVLKEFATWICELFAKQYKLLVAKN